MVHRILVGSYTTSIATLEFDPSATPSPSLKVISSVKSAQNPSWIALHPTDRTLLYATIEQTEGMVQVFKINLEDGSLEFVKEASSGGADPASLAVTAEAVLVANVGSIPPLLRIHSPQSIIPPVFSLLVPTTVLGRQLASHSYLNVTPIPSRTEATTNRVPGIGTQQGSSGRLASSPSNSPPNQGRGSHSRSWN